MLQHLLNNVRKQSDNILIELGKEMSPVRVWISGLGYKWYSGPVNGDFHEMLHKTAQKDQP